MTLIYIIIEFIKISLFSFGGGYGTLPFIYYIAGKYGWYSIKEIMNMVAVAAITPGAFGVNMATYTGFKIYGFWGAIIATAALIIPSFILSILVYKVLKKFKESPVLNNFLETLRAIASGLLFVVTLQMINHEIFHFSIKTLSIDFQLKSLLFLILSTLIYLITKKNIIITMLLTLIFGAIMKYFGVL